MANLLFLKNLSGKYLLAQNLNTGCLLIKRYGGFFHEEETAFN
jgi:hypothetical protein